MCSTVIRKWLLIIASGACLLTSACPTLDQLRGVLADSIEIAATSTATQLISDMFTSMTGT